MEDLNCKEPKESSSAGHSTNLAGILRAAKARMREDDLEGAFELLKTAEAEYVQSVELFDLLGETLLRSGSTLLGVRYKTLHEVLKGTFKIAMQEIAMRGGDKFDSASPRAGAPQPVASLLDLQPPDQQWEAPVQSPRRETAPDEDEPPPEGPTSDANLFPVTAAMGLEFMRQGHFERAVEVFDRLLEDRPEDPALKAARQRALNRDRGSHILDVLERWLRNIDRMKSHPPDKRLP